MGPPNLAKAEVFSYTVTSKPFLSMQSAVVSPPTPPPAIATFKGLPARAGTPSSSKSAEAADAKPSISPFSAIRREDFPKDWLVLGCTTLGCTMKAAALEATARTTRHDSEIFILPNNFDNGCQKVEVLSQVPQKVGRPKASCQVATRKWKNVPPHASSVQKATAHTYIDSRESINPIISREEKSTHTVEKATNIRTADKIRGYLLSSWTES
jgi:hypothetical protein